MRLPGVKARFGVDSSEYRSLQRDVANNIERNVRVPFEAKVRCISDFAARADVRMRVCGACGLRDPGDACEHEVVLAALSSEHWLHVGAEAWERMQAQSIGPLLRRRADDNAHTKICVPMLCSGLCGRNYGYSS